MSDPTPTRSNANEKKVWRPLSATQVSPPKGSRNADCTHFLAIEELQGAWINNVWEEAEGGTMEEWEEEFTHPDGTSGFKTVRKEIPRATRYVLKYFNADGYAKNALSSYDGPRAYK